MSRPISTNMPPPFAPLYPTHAPPPFQRPQPTQAKRKASAQSLSNESPASKRGRTPGGSSPSTRNTRQRDRSETPSRPGGSNEPLVAEKEESSGHWKSYVTPDGTRTAEDFIVEWLTEVSSTSVLIPSLSLIMHVIRERITHHTKYLSRKERKHMENSF
jgi:hypothetical protein